MAIKTMGELESRLAKIESNLDAATRAGWLEKHFNGVSVAPEAVEFGHFLKWLGAKGITNREKILQGIDMEKVATVRKADLGTPLYSDATTGSYLVPVDFHRAVVRVAEESSVLYPKTTRVPMNSRTMSLAVESTSLSFEWCAAQTSALSEILPTFDTKSITSYTVAGWIGMTESLLEDQAVNVSAHFAQVFGEKFGLELDSKILNGTGVPCTGLLQEPAGIHVLTMGAGQTSQSDVTADDLLNLVSELTLAKYRRGSSFFMNPGTFDVVRGLKDANGRFLIDMTSMNPPALFGYPVYLSDSIATATASKCFILFGNPRHIYVGERKNLEVKLFDQTAYAVEYEEVFLRARARIGISIPIPAAFAVLKTSAS